MTDLITVFVMILVFGMLGVVEYSANLEQARRGRAILKGAALLAVIAVVPVLVDLVVG